MSNSQISQHKRMAMGQDVGMKRGGSVVPVGAPGTSVPKPALSGGGNSPLTNARRNNGVPGMKSGGKMCKGGGLKNERSF